MRPLPPPIHQALRVSKIFLTFLSVLMACLCVLIILRTPSISNDYGRLLLMVILLATLLDVYSQLIFDPEYIFMPYICVFRDDPLINIPLNAAWAFIFWASMVLLTPPFYGACFIYRHQIVVPSDSIFKLPRYGRQTIVCLIAIPCLSYGYAYYLAWADPSENDFQIISAIWDHESVDRMECFIEYQFLRNAWAFVLALFGFIMFGFITFHTFSIIHRASNLSKRTRSFHRTMIISLIILVIIPLSFILVPFSSSMVYFTLVEEDQFPLMEIGTFVFAFHSVVHSLVLIFITPVFRKRLIQMFRPKSFAITHPAPSLQTRASII